MTLQNYLFNEPWSNLIWRDYNASKEVSLNKDGNYEITLIAPGANKDDFKIETDDKYLTISYKREDNQYCHSFLKKYILPENAESVNASYQNGILKVIVATQQPVKKIIPVNFN